MLDDLSHFQQAFQKSPVVAEDSGRVPIKLKKTWWEWFTFFLINLVLLPPISLIAASIVADGNRILLPLTQRKLHQLPIPGASFIKSWDGWSKLDLAYVAALFMFIVMTWVYYKVFTELMGYGRILPWRTEKPILFYVLCSICGIVILADACLFYYGLSSQTSSGWTNAPSFISPMATLMYLCILAGLSWFHADFHHSKYL